jgi:hypothetical protein
MDPTRPSSHLRRPAVPTAGLGPLQLLLSSSTDLGGESALPTFAGRGVYAASFLWRGEADLLAAGSGLRYRAQARATAATRVGLDGGLSQTALELELAGTQTIPLLITGHKYRTPQPSLEHRHHLYSAAKRVCLFGGDPRLVQPLCAGLGALDQFGRGSVWWPWSER